MNQAMPPIAPNAMPTIRLDRCDSIYVPQIRYMLRHDRDRVMEIEYLSFGDPWTWDYFCAVCSKNRVLPAVVVIRGEVACYMVYDLGGRAMRIINLAVAPHIRRRGLGRLMVRTTQSIAAKAKKPVQVNVAERNVDGQLFFRALGFECTAIKRHCYCDGQDGYRFVWKEPTC